MARSMTGYGKAVHQSDKGSIIIEISSVNRKFFDLTLNLPRELSALMPVLRKIIEKEVASGAITCSIRFIGDLPFTIAPNIALAKELYSALKTLEKELGVSLSIDTLLQQNDLFLKVDTQDEQWSTLLLPLMVEALRQFNQSRLQEGNALTQDMKKRILSLQNGVTEIEALQVGLKERLRAKLLPKVLELVPTLADNEERVIRELALYLEKSDVQEEITRLHAHLSQFEQLLESERCGKQLDFLSQEIGRELSTLGAKASELTVIQKVIELKTEAARIKEQIQNVE